MAIPESFIQEVILRNPLEELVGQYSTVKRAGSNLVCCCPFHNEKTPSFTIYSNPSHFYCYGCGAGGDVITFVRRMENLDYVSAIEFLADRAGLPMPQQTFTEKRVDKKRYYEMNASAARFWHENLLSPQGKEGLDYLKKRGLELPIIKRFGLGYASLSWNALTDHLTKEGYSAKEIQENFLGGINKSGKLFDYFRGRAMFPIIDAAGNVVAFSGRLVESTKDDDRKYFNTNDTPVFKKSRTVFALNLAKNCPEKELILCEGNMDVVSLHAHGISNAVASLGTALTEEQCRLLSRYTDRVSICYDADEAGKRATKKAIRLLQQLGLKVRVITLEGKTPDGKEVKDPDDFIRAFGKGAFDRYRNDAPGALEYLFGEIKSRYPLDSMDSKNAFIKECIALLSQGTTPIEKALYISKISQVTGIPESVIQNSLQAGENKTIRKNEKEQLEKEIKKTQGLGNRINPDKAKFVSSAAKEESILGILLICPEYLQNRAIRPRLQPKIFRCEFCRRVLSSLLCLTEEEPLQFSALNESFSPEEMGEIEGLKKKRAGLGNHTSVLEELLLRLEEQQQKTENGLEPLSSDWLNHLRNQKK